VIVHDAARPLAEADLFLRALAELGRPGVDAVVAATPVTDTIKEVATADEVARTAGAAGEPTTETSRVTRTLDRRGLWAVQTPQVFRRGVLERVLAGASAAHLAAATDDAWLVEQAGGSVAVLPVRSENFKITTRLDLRLAELILAERTEPR
jgi:2-C-methyl-D-erythritol 4-phosphate cytidylyltransferase